MNTDEFNNLLNLLKYDGTAIAQIYEFYYKRIVYRLTPVSGREIAEDSAQEFFLNLLEFANKDYIQNPTAWIYKCCENLARRKVANNSKYILAADVFANCDETEDEYEELRKTIGRFDPATQRILKMLYWDGYNQKEIAEKLELSAVNVRKKHSRAIKDLKNILTEYKKN